MGLREPVERQVHLEIPAQVVLLETVELLDLQGIPAPADRLAQVVPVETAERPDQVGIRERLDRAVVQVLRAKRAIKGIRERLKKRL